MEKYKIEFFNYPRYYPGTVYEATIKRVSERYLPSVSAIYTFGSKITPGISDIDFIMVVDDKSASIPISLRLFLLDKKAKYVVSHPFFFITKGDMEDIRLIYPNANFKLVAGKEVSLNKINTEENRFCELVTSIDLILRHFPRDYLISLSKNRVDVRELLLRLNALTISFDALKRGGRKTEPGWDDFYEEIKRVRRTWFTMDKKGRERILLRLGRSAIHISIGLTEEFNRLLRRYVYVEGEGVIYRGFQNKAMFIKNWSREGATDWVKKKRVYVPLPLEFAALLSEYSKHKGPVSNYIKRNLEGNIDFEIKNRALIKKRVDILNNQALLANRLKHSHFTAFIDFGYKSNSGIINKIFNLIKKIKHRKI